MECNQIVFYIITGCTHNCKLCVSGVPYYREQHKNYVVSLSDAQLEIDATFKLFSYVKRITVTGGEPLLHPELTEILNHIMKYSDQFGECRIFSNGSLMPSEKLFSVIKNSNKKLSFVINDYGSKLSPHAEKIHQRTGCRVNHYTGKDQYFDGWVDYGSLNERRPYSEDEALDVMNHCHFTDWKMYNIFQGKLFYCTRAAIGMDLGFFELSERDYVDLIPPPYRQDVLLH